MIDRVQRRPIDGLQSPIREHHVSQEQVASLESRLGVKRAQKFIEDHENAHERFLNLVGKAEPYSVLVRAASSVIITGARLGSENDQRQDHGLTQYAENLV